MRQLKPEQWIVLGLVLLAVAYGGYLAVGQSRRNADLTAPQRQPAPEDDLFAGNAGLWSPDGHGVLCHPSQHHAGYTYTRHRYPRVHGGEITALIHHGFSPMRVPHVDDVQWIISPPSEVAW